MSAGEKIGSHFIVNDHAYIKKKKKNAHASDMIGNWTTRPPNKLGPWQTRPLLYINDSNDNNNDVF